MIKGTLMKLDPEKQDLLDKTLVVLGLALVAMSVALLFYIGISAYNFLQNPEQIAFVRIITENATASDRAAYGTFQGESFELHLSPAVTSGFVLLVLVMLLGTIAGAAGTIMTSGLKLVKAGQRQNVPEKTDFPSTQERFTRHDR